MVDTVFEGHDVQVIDDVEKWEECATHCFQMKDVCTHFSWKDKTCSLKDSDEGEQEEQGGALQEDEAFCDVVEPGRSGRRFN